MSRYVNWTAVAVVLIAVGCGGDAAPAGPDDAGDPLNRACGGDGSDLVFFDDARLEAAVRGALGLIGNQELTCARASGLKELDASFLGVSSLGGIESLIGLQNLTLWGNELSDVDPVRFLIGLEGISLRSNLLSDIEVLGELTNLTNVDLGQNAISDIGPLVGLVDLRTLLLSDNAITDVTGWCPERS